MIIRLKFSIDAFLSGRVNLLIKTSNFMNLSSEMVDFDFLFIKVVVLLKNIKKSISCMILSFDWIKTLL